MNIMPVVVGGAYVMYSQGLWSCWYQAVAVTLGMQVLVAALFPMVHQILLQHSANPQTYNDFLPLIT